MVDLKRNAIQTIVEGLKEPGGLVILSNQLIICDSNNHCLKSFDLLTKTIKTIEIQFPKPKQARLLKPATSKIIEKEIFFVKGLFLVLRKVMCR
jgi:hypothetical protein